MVAICFTHSKYGSFFFSVDEESENIHVMTINCGWPYRVVDESLGYHCIGKYFRFKKSPIKKVKICSTWKVWNTSFILDMETANALSGYAKKRNKDYFEYVIATQDEYIELISLNAPSWEFYQNIEIQKLINDYTEKSLKEKSRSREYQKEGGNMALQEDFVPNFPKVYRPNFLESVPLVKLVAG